MVAALQPENDGKQIVLDRAVILVGRSPDCDAVITASSKISRLHCAVVQVDDGFFLRDLGSMNGCWVNGTRVEKVARISPGDSIAIGDQKFRFQENVQIVSSGGAEESPVAPQKHYPVLIDQQATQAPQKRRSDEIVEAVEVVDDTAYVPSGRKKRSRQDDVVEIIDDVELVEEIEEVVEISEADVEVVDDVEVVEEVVDVVDDIEIVDDLEVVDDVEVVDEVELVDEVEIIPDDDVIEDVEIIEEVDLIDDLEPPQQRSSRKSRRRRMR